MHEQATTKEIRSAATFFFINASHKIFYIFFYNTHPNQIQRRFDTDTCSFRKHQPCFAEPRFRFHDVACIVELIERLCKVCYESGYAARFIFQSSVPDNIRIRINQFHKFEFFAAFHLRQICIAIIDTAFHRFSQNAFSSCICVLYIRPRFPFKIKMSFQVNTMSFSLPFFRKEYKIAPTPIFSATSSRSSIFLLVGLFSITSFVFFRSIPAIRLPEIQHPHDALKALYPGSERIQSRHETQSFCPFISHFIKNRENLLKMQRLRHAYDIDIFIKIIRSFSYK